MEKLLPSNLQITPNNPLYAQNAGQNAAQQYYNQAIVPQLGAGAEQQFLGGNLGNSGESTFGAGYMGNLAATGAQQSFFAGQDYLNNEINNQLAERQSYFGNDVGLGQQQSNLYSGEQQQASMFNSGQNQQAQEFNTQYPLQQGQLAMGMQNNLYNQQLQYQEAKAQNTSNLLTGGLGLGLGSLFAGAPMLGKMFGGSSGSSGGGGGFTSGGMPQSLSGVPLMNF